MEVNRLFKISALGLTMTSISYGHTNSGVQVGINHGPIYPSAERPETPPRPLSTVPFRRDPDFIDRRSLLDQISEKGTTPGARVALVGLGGVGKSQLAIEYCYRIREQSPETWVFWIHAGNTARFEQSCWDIADRVKIPGRRNSANIFKVIHDWLSDERHGKWVLILDNVDDSRFLHEVPPVGQGGQQSDGTSGRPLSTYLPISPHGSMIVTSRSRGAAYSIVDDSDVITIEPMDPLQATILFEKKLGSQVEKEIILQLATALDCMPLAIVQAAAYIKQRTPRLSVLQYLKEYQKSDRQKTSLLAYDGGQLRRDREAKNSILITWQISIDHIQRTKPAAADLLSLMSFFDRQGIPGTLLQRRATTGGDDKISALEDEAVSSSGTESRVDDEFEENILVLRNYSMISTSMDGATFEMHRLVQLAMRKWLEAHGQLEHWRRRFIEILYCEFPKGNFEDWGACQPLFTHVQSAVIQPPDEEEILTKWADLLHRAAWFAITKGDVLESEKIAILAMKTRERLFGPHDEQTIDSYEMAGLAYRLNGKWKDAEILQLRVMKTRRQVLGLEHPKTLTSMSNLATIYRYQGRWKEAEDLQVRVMETSRQVLGPEHPDTLSSMSNLASTYWNQGRWKEAEDLEIRVMETRKQVLGPEHPDTLRSIANLATIYWNQGRWKEAEDIEVQLIETSRQVLGPEHPDTLRSIANLASTYWNQGRWKEAEDLYVQVIEASRQVLGPEHPDTLSSIANLAVTYRNQGRWKEAEDLHVQVMETRKQVLGPEHPDTLRSIANLASIYWNQGRWKEAEDLHVQVMETRKQVLGPEHPDTLRSIANLAVTYWNQGRWKEAEDLHVQVIEASRQVLGPEHPDTLTSIAILASTYQNQGRWKEAEDLHVQVIETSRQVLGPEHPDTLRSIANLASTYWNQGRWKEAEDLHVQVIETSRQVLGPEHPDTLRSIANLASIYWNQGRWKEAEDLHVQVIETRKQVLGPEHPDTLSSMHNTAYTLRSLGQLEPALHLMAECVRLRSRILGHDHPDTISSISTLNDWDSTGGASTEVQVAEQTNTTSTEPSERASTTGRPRRRAVISRLFFRRK
ncbi:P-loop containing nucleoside triphosphate hydrolase protein [Penicillium canariense]|uniref:P-loop containing nucleoside triphosphate hydrolase protein n=1 Tax=Penicillium canariense TaxID=189055 RepID=A0A9W9IBU0_9EURO|nr:P-loop containing nucleoside triphosphate hydrolase protein [Penicillium canariense]KAJ5174495.1 P-loop containing nucleoside triphosphate hydrolase protein [Penicillium canariense]